MPFSFLKDVTVVECSTFVTGPYAASLLGDLGARVIKIESPPDGDPYRYFAPDPFLQFQLRASESQQTKSGSGSQIIQG